MVLAWLSRILASAAPWLHWLRCWLSRADPAHAGAYHALQGDTGAVRVVSSESEADPVLPSASGADPVLSSTSGADPVLSSTSEADPVLPSTSEADLVLPSESEADLIAASDSEPLLDFASDSEPLLNSPSYSESDSELSAEEPAQPVEGPHPSHDHSFLLAFAALRLLLSQQADEAQAPPMSLLKPSNEPFFTAALRCSTLCLARSKDISQPGPVHVIDQPWSAQLIFLAHSVVSQPEKHLISVDHNPDALSYCKRACELSALVTEISDYLGQHRGILPPTDDLIPDLALLWPAFQRFQDAYRAWDGSVRLAENRKVKFALQCLYRAYPICMQETSHPTFVRDFHEELRLHEAKLQEIAQPAEVAAFKAAFGRPKLRMELEANADPPEHEAKEPHSRFLLYHDLLVFGRQFNHDTFLRYREAVGNTLRSPFNLSFGKCAADVLEDMVVQHGCRQADVLYILRECLVLCIPNLAREVQPCLLGDFKVSLAPLLLCCYFLPDVLKKTQESTRSLQLAHLIESDAADFADLWVYASMVIEASARCLSIDKDLLATARNRIALFAQGHPGARSLRHRIEVSVSVVRDVVAIADDCKRVAFNHQVGLARREDDSVKACCLQVIPRALPVPA